MEKLPSRNFFAGIPRGELRDLRNKLGGPEGEMWLLAFRRFLRRENPWPSINLIKQMSIVIGGIPKNELIQRISARGDKISSSARSVVARLVFSSSFSEPKEVSFGWITAGGLGFTEGSTAAELFARIKEVGGLCSEEDALYLRLADTNQQPGMIYGVATEPIPVFDGYHPRIFIIERDGGGNFWLDVTQVGPTYWCRPDKILVLRIR